MICEKCGRKMKQGTACFSSRSYNLDLLKPSPRIDFCVGNTTLDCRDVNRQDGWYCTECGIFTLSFNIKNMGYSKTALIWI